MKEFKKDQLKVIDMELNDDDMIESQLECWFDCDEKFGTHTNIYDSAWVNLYARYNTKDNNMKLLWEEDSPISDGELHEYIPTENEYKVVYSLLQEYCEQQWQCTMKELDTIILLLNKFQD